MERILNIKSYVLFAIGAIGGVIATYLGGWDNTLKALIIFMGVDFATGWIVAGVFKKSGKSEDGALRSSVGWKGLCKKGATLLVVLIATQLDILAGTAVVRDAVVFGYIANEGLSIIENLGLMGVPMLPIVTDAIDLLKRKSENRGVEK